MKETLTLLAISLAVLIVSASSFKNVSTFAIADVDAKKSETVEDTVKPEKKGEAKEQPDKTESVEEAETAEKTEETPSATEQPKEESADEQQSAVQETAPAETPAAEQVVPPPPVQQNTYTTNTSSLSTAAERLNSASLNPSYTSCSELNNAINSILSQVTNGNMSTYEKVKACYMYIINTCDEGRLSGSYSYKTGGWNINAQALGLFTEHRGMCDCYSAGFTVLARAIGLNCSQVEGDIPYYTDHDWCHININGTTYIFDVDVEEDTSYSGREHYFCKTYSELPEYYYKRTIG